jgi:hypothetical protein
VPHRKEANMVAHFVLVFVSLLITFVMEEGIAKHKYHAEVREQPSGYFVGNQIEFT